MFHQTLNYRRWCKSCCVHKQAGRTRPLLVSGQTNRTHSQRFISHPAVALRSTSRPVLWVIFSLRVFSRKLHLVFFCRRLLHDVCEFECIVCGLLWKLWNGSHQLQSTCHSFLSSNPGFKGNMVLFSRLYDAFADEFRMRLIISSLLNSPLSSYH